MSNYTPVPHLVVNDGEAAISFYEKAFGAKLETKHPSQDGKRLMHAHLKLGSSALLLHDDFPEFGDQGAKPPTRLGARAAPFISKYRMQTWRGIGHLKRARRL